MQHQTPAAQSDLLSVAIDDLGVLRAAYMPFVKDGGLFIPTANRYRLGDEVFVLLRLPDEPASVPLAGEVVWITPEGCHGGKPAGIGIRFNDRDDAVRRRIEACLAALPGGGGGGGEEETYTM